MTDFREEPLQYGVKLVFGDGTVILWYRDSKRRTVYAERNPHGYRLPRSAAALEEILAAMDPDRAAPAEMIDEEGVPLGAFDGGADPNPGVGGWGVVLPDGRELFGGEPRTTNNRMELTGAIRLLEETSGPLHLIGDSHYVIAGITRWIHAWLRNDWKTVAGQPVENRDLWERLWALTRGRRLHWERVAGHSGHTLNERCDRLAARGRASVEGRPPR